MPHANWLRRFRRETRAGAMVEFAIVAPVLILLVFGIAEFGRFFFLLNNLTNAAREGARRAAIEPTFNSAMIVGVVRERIFDTNKATGGTIKVEQVGAAPNQTVRVTITNYPFARSSFLPITLTIVPAIQAVFRYEFQ